MIGSITSCYYQPNEVETWFFSFAIVNNFKDINLKKYLRCIWTILSLISYWNIWMVIKIRNNNFLQIYTIVRSCTSLQFDDIFSKMFVGQYEVWPTQLADVLLRKCWVDLLFPSLYLGHVVLRVTLLFLFRFCTEVSHY